MNSHENVGQQRLLTVLEALADELFDGVTSAALARKVGESPTNTFRALKNLEAAGWAEQRPTKTWCITPKATVLSRRVHDALAREERRYLGSGPLAEGGP